MKQEKFYQTVHNHISDIMPKIRKPAVGKYPAPYLTVTWGSFYAMIFGWDNHHMSLRFAADGEICEMKYYLMNMLTFQDADGFTPNCSSQDGGWEPKRKFHAQPYLAQNAAIYYSLSKDAEFVRSIYPKLEAYLAYYFREMHCENGLYCWRKTYMSGLDNEISGTVFPLNTILAADLNAWLVQECKAMAYLAENLSLPAGEYADKASKMTEAINTYLWDEEYGSYGNYNLAAKRVQIAYGADPLPGETGKYCFMSCVTFPLLYAGIVPEERAERMIRQYLISEDHFLCDYGLRSLTKKSEFYSGAVWGNPPRFGEPEQLTLSNWQGPVWVISNFFAIIGLARYGFKKEAVLVTERLLKNMAFHIEKMGFMRENYCGETGTPLYADYFASWNILADLLPDFAAGNPPLNLFPWEKN